MREKERWREKERRYRCGEPRRRVTTVEGREGKSICEDNLRIAPVTSGCTGTASGTALGARVRCFLWPGFFPSPPPPPPSPPPLLLSSTSNPWSSPLSSS